MPPKIQQSNAKHYKSDTITEIMEFEGPHLLPAPGRLGGGRRLRAGLGAQPRDQRGRDQRVKDVRLTHIGGPTVLIEVGGWRLLTDPTFDPPGRRYFFGWGTIVAQARRAGDRRRRPARRSTRCCSATTTTATTSTPPAARCCRRPASIVTTASGAKRLGGSARGLAAVADHAARGARPAADRDHRHAVPARPAAEPPDRRRRDRLRAALGRPGARRALDLGRHRALRRRARGRRPAAGRHGAAAPRRRALPGVGARCATR